MPNSTLSSLRESEREAGGAARSSVGAGASSGRRQLWQLHVGERDEAVVCAIELGVASEAVGAVPERPLGGEPRVEPRRVAVDG